LTRTVEATTIELSHSEKAVTIVPFRMSTSLVYALLITAVLLADFTISALPNQPAADQDADYTHAITERADKIVGTLGIDDAAKATRVRDDLVRQYRSLREIHDTRDARIDEANRSPGGDPTIAAAWNKVARDDASLRLVQAHRYFVARLSAKLSPEQVEKVKDGMTYGIVSVTYDRYLTLLPKLNDEERGEILANLIEAREYAMDAGSSEEKHAVFGKYKGRINNYLSAAGHDLKQAEKQLNSKKGSSSPTP